MVTTNERASKRRRKKARKNQNNRIGCGRIERIERSGKDKIEKTARYIFPMGAVGNAVKEQGETR